MWASPHLLPRLRPTAQPMTPGLAQAFAMAGMGNRAPKALHTERASKVLLHLLYAPNIHPSPHEFAGSSPVPDSGRDGSGVFPGGNHTAHGNNHGNNHGGHGGHHGNHTNNMRNQPWAQQHLPGPSVRRRVRGYGEGLVLQGLQRMPSGVTKSAWHPCRGVCVASAVLQQLSSRFSTICSNRGAETVHDVCSSAPGHT